jgi:sulfide:quinone oxidoreductase
MKRIASFLAVIGIQILFIGNKVWGFSAHSYLPATTYRREMVLSMSSGGAPRKLVIVGGGIGGLASAFDARHNFRPTDEITVISDRDKFYFTPSNPWIATRKRKPEDISLDLKPILSRHHVNFVHGKVSNLDTKLQEIHLDNGSKITYDYMIIATGPRLAFDEIPGSKDFGLSVCTTPHASHAADVVDKLVLDPGPVVIGSTQGASCFGPAYEFLFLLHTELKKRGGQALLDQCPMTYVTSEPYIGHLGLKGAGDSQKILEDLMAKKKIESYANCKINNVAPDHLSITKVDESKTFQLPSKLTMLIPPFRGHDIWKRVPKLTDEKGMIRINEFQQSPEYPNIFGVGICCSIPPVDKTLVPTGAPKTGYLIESQGTAAVLNIKTMMDHAEKDKDDESAGLPELSNRPLLNGLCITDFGDDGAIFLTLPQYPPRRTDITMHGKLAVMAKIAFEKYFLHKIETGDTDPYYEKYMLHLIGVDRVTSKKKTN